MRIALMVAEQLARRLAPQAHQRADAEFFGMEFRVLREAFAHDGMVLEAALWTDVCDWNEYEAVLVKCAWDYQDRLDDFLRTLDAVETSGAAVFNSPSQVRWNIRKTYLRDLEDAGVPIVPTLWPEEPKAENIVAAFEVFDADELVLKRQVGAGARAQQRFTRSDAFADGPLLDRPGMIQPLMPMIREEGEFSFLFIDGEISHSVLKRAKAGDYRIQEAYGGVAHAIEPAPADLAQARSVLDALEVTPLYARVDMVRGEGGGLRLMELELIEPYLFPAQGVHIGAMLSHALRRRLGLIG
jgi:glutathione synthase/RimK-type ligase-like ATP-grasp enzyme